MSSREVIASKISQKILHRLIPDLWPGTVGAIFERSLNVEMRDDFLIHIGSAPLPLTPRSILFREEDFCKRLRSMCFSGQPVGIEKGFISLGQEKVNLFHPQTRRYDPRLDLAGGLLAPREILNNLLAALRGVDGAREKKGEKFFSPFRGYFLSRISMIGRPRFAPLAGPGMLDGESDLSRRMKNALWQRADGFLRAMSRQDWVEARKFAHGIIGFGPGLTPSGDDFLAGFISAGAILEGSSGGMGNRREAVSIATAVVREEAAGRTNSVSLAMLADAANGEVAEPVKHFLRSAIQTGDGREIYFWSGEISHIGGSSGVDLLNGLASGILFFQRDRTRLGKQ
jgi:hypothetical protein